MSDELPMEWPLPPSQAASVVHQLCMAMADTVLHECGHRISRRTYLKLCGLSVAAELVAGDAARWYGTRMGKDEDLLAALEERYLAEAGRR